MLLLRKHKGKVVRMSFRISSGGFDDCIPILWDAETGGSQTRSEPRFYRSPPPRLTMTFLNFKTKSKTFMRNNKFSFPKTNTVLNK